MLKYLMNRLFSNMQSFPFQIRYWDGESVVYGQGKPRLTLVFKNKLPLLKWARSPVLSFGEAYMNGTVDIEGTIADVIKLASDNRNLVWKNTPSFLRKGIPVRQEMKNVQHHYDVGNKFYALWLDESMSYSCAYFHSSDDTLEQAQLQKIDYVLKKLQLQPGETLLDIGSGWGWLIIQAAEKYGVKAKGITLSEEQYKKTLERIKEHGLEGQVDVELVDYRQLAQRGETFDKIAIVGMFEHVGQKNFPAFMNAVQRLLKDKGLAMLHTITQAKELPPDPWIQKYIFPGGYIPSAREVIYLLPEYGFHLLDVENLRTHYARTLNHWARRFEASVDQIREMFDERFVRMWRLYLNSSEASFRTGDIHLHQILFSKGINDELSPTRDFLYR